jgi:hypothetical protein
MAVEPVPDLPDAAGGLSRRRAPQVPPAEPVPPPLIGPFDPAHSENGGSPSGRARCARPRCGCRSGPDAETLSTFYEIYRSNARAAVVLSMLFYYQRVPFEPLT